MDFKSKSAKIGYVCMAAALLIIGAICVFPPLWIFMSAFKNIKEFLAIPPTIFPHTFEPEKLPMVWNRLHFGRYYLNSFMLAAGDLAFCIVSNGLAGYVLSRLKPRGTKVFMFLILWTMMLPTTTSTVPLFMTFIDVPYLHLNLSDTFWPMWLMSGANAFNVLLFKNFFDSIPMSYLEAARLDGCSNLGIFGRIILPLSKPILIVVSIFSFNGSWENFFWPYLVLKDKSNMTVAVQVFQLKSLPVDEYMIILLLSIIPPAIIFCIFQKYIMGGINLGGVKG